MSPPRFSDYCHLINHFSVPSAHRLCWVYSSNVYPALISHYRHHHLSNRFPPVVFCKFRFYRLFYASSHTALVPGLLLPPTSSRFWNWACCHCLAGLRFGCFLRFLRCLRFAKPRYTERTLRRVQFHVSQVSPFTRYHCLRVYLASISSFALASPWNHTHYIIGHQAFVFFLLNFDILLGCSSEPSRSGVGAFLLDFTKTLRLTRCWMRSHSGAGAFRRDFTRARSARHRTLLWCLLLWSEEALENSSLPSVAHSFLPGCGRYTSWTVEWDYLLAVP